MSINTSSSYFEYWFGHNNSGKGVAIADATNLTGNWTGTHYSDGQYQQMSAGSTAGNGSTLVSANANPAGTSNVVFFDQDFDVTFILRTVGTATERIWCVFVDQNTRMGNNDTFPGTGKVIGFRYSTPASDTGWTGFCQDGNTGSTSNTGSLNTISANTQYSLRMRTVSGIAYFSVDGGAETSVLTNVPTSNTPAMWSFEIWNTSTGGTKSVEIGRVSCSIPS